jgi:hypothetical protein
MSLLLLSFGLHASICELESNGCFPALFLENFGGTGRQCTVVWKYTARACGRKQEATHGLCRHLQLTAS